MEKIKEKLKKLHAFGILIFILWLIYIFIKNIGLLAIKGIEKIANITSTMDSVVIVALITGGISLVTVLISSIISKFLEYRQTTKRYLYEKRKKPYSKFISMVYKLQMSNRNGHSEYTEEQMINDIANFSQELTLWGSSRVIKKWIKFIELSRDQKNVSDNLFLLEEIVFEIRKDMGQGKKGLKKGDLLSFFVNDIKKYLYNNKSEE